MPDQFPNFHETRFLDETYSPNAQTCSADADDPATAPAPIPATGNHFPLIGRQEWHRHNAKGRRAGSEEMAARGLGWRELRSVNRFIGCGCLLQKPLGRCIAHESDELFANGRQLCGRPLPIP